MTHDEFIAATVDWLNRRVAPDGVVVDADTRLFDTGVIDSLGILRLIAWTEHALGRRIADREIRMDRFGSVRAMAAGFAEGGCAAERRCAAAGCGAPCRACGACVRRAA